MQIKYEKLLRPLDAEEYKRLETSIKEEGLRDALVVWEEQDILLDGHNRYKICNEWGETLKFEYVSLGSEAEARKWIINNQLGRRNLTPTELSYFRGLRYKEERASPYRPEQGMEKGAKTASLLSQEFGVSERTIHNDANFAEAVDEGTEKFGEEFRHKALKGEISKKDVIESVNPKKAHVSNNSGENEWYTPPKYIESCHKLFDGIELDPASSIEAQKYIQALKYFTKEDDGLVEKWEGYTWMNPPYSKDLIEKFINKIVAHYRAGDIPAAVVLVNNATETSWFYTLIKTAAAVVFTKGRIKFIDKNGNPSGAPLQGQALVYLGTMPEMFLAEFEQYGWGAMIHGKR